MKANHAKRLKELETENGRLKPIVADLTLNVALDEVGLTQGCKPVVSKAV
jgi:hypothetical protein